ncbi:MAG: NAD(P)/FAD-dependent oxidoreductase [Candidatus Thorarchaeota archaeon]
MERVDVVVVGAGSAGCVTARRCAELGLKTLLLDRKSRELVGNKVCGDEVSKSHFDATGIDYPMGDEVAGRIAGADVYPPSMTGEMKVRGWADFDGWTLNRLRFGQRLLLEAVQAGVRVECECHVTEPLVQGSRVVGVEYQRLNTDQSVSVNAKLVVDASGFAAVIRNKIDDEYVEKYVDSSDVALCHREILRLSMPLAEPEVAHVYLGSTFAPGGYAWVFPRGPNEVNAGVGIGGGRAGASPRQLMLKFREDNPLFYGSEVIHSGGGAVPVRRPLKSCVGNGVAFVGDAALQANPIHGGGIGVGMRAATVLGEAAKEAIARRDTSVRGLWSYNVRFMAGVGRRLASLEVFRRFLQAVDDDDLDFGFARRILEPSDLILANQGEGISLGPLAKLKRLRRGIGRPRLLVQLNRAVSLMKRMNRLYSDYPTRPEDLEHWNAEVLDLIERCRFS